MTSVRTSLVATLLALAITSARAQHPLNIQREEIMIPMRDGVKLHAIVYRPDSDGRFPCIVYRTPYGSHDYDSYAEFPLKAAKNGYAVFIVDVRGRYASEGNFEAYRNEKQDGYDLIEWVGKQWAFSNGTVGTYGGSYPGFVQWLAMSQGPASLKASAPDMTPIHSHQFFFVGGAFSYGWLDWFSAYMLADLRKRAGDKSGTWDDLEAEQQWETQKFKWYSYRPLGDNPVLKKYAPYYYEWLRHPERTSWWDFANTEKEFGKMSAPALIHTGWYDAVYGLLGAAEGFRKMKAESATSVSRNGTRLIIGPWNHTTPGVRKTKFGEMENGVSAGLDFDDLLMDWFDHHLKGSPADQNEMPVSIFVMGANKWRYEKEWPPARAQPTSFYLRDKHLLSTMPPKSDKPDSYVFLPHNPLFDSSYQKPFAFDQRKNESRSDVVVYTSEPLEADMEVTGQVVAELFVSSSAKDTDFSFTLCDVYPDGTSLNLASLESGYLRMRYRNGTAAEELMVPNAKYKIRIDNYYTSNVFKKGHRIRVWVTSSKFPHYDVNTNTGTILADETKMEPAVNIIYRDETQASRIILPVIPADQP
jgi:putative CocE/NonD family hydrolase